MRTLLTILLGTSLLSLGATEPVTEQFTITTRRDSDRVTVQSDDQQTVFAIHSPVGISGAEIMRTGDRWPARIVLQLHLSGLEQFTLAHDKQTIAASVSSHNGTARVWISGQEETPLTPTSPDWLAIRLISRQVPPVTTIPLKKGHFEIDLPQQFLHDNPQVFKLTWIDFYRN